METAEEKRLPSVPPPHGSMAARVDAVVKIQTVNNTKKVTTGVEKKMTLCLMGMKIISILV